MGLRRKRCPSKRSSTHTTMDAGPSKRSRLVKEEAVDEGIGWVATTTAPPDMDTVHPFMGLGIRERRDRQDDKRRFPRPTPRETGV